METEISPTAVEARVVVVGQTPPPYHGQSMMIALLLKEPMQNVKMFHVRMAFSDRMDQVGRFQFSKLMHLVVVLVRIVWMRFWHSANILYYPPAGPNKVPLYRDLILLGCTRWLFRRTIYHFHANGISELLSSSPAPLRWIANCILGRPDISIQLTEELSADARYLASKRVRVIPNAVDDPMDSACNADDKVHCAAADKNELQATESIDSKPPSLPPVLMYLGTVSEGKGVLVLLEACLQLRTRNVPFHLNIVGSYQSKDFETEVQEWISQNDMHSCVSVLGQKTGSEKWSLLQHADVFCFPTHYNTEGFPCVLLEAMCASLPIVSTKWRGIPSIVSDGATGFLVEPRDVEALADRIQQLIHSPTLRKAFGDAARVRYDQHFTVEKHRDRMRAVFLEASR